MSFGIIDQYDVVTYKGKNLGDYVQTIAALQFLPTNVISIKREQMNMPSPHIGGGGGKIYLLMASWFMSHPYNFPPSSQIVPLFISSHFTQKSLNIILNDNEGYNYFKKYEPIGCRDTQTAETLNKKGIRAYFSACLTLTLGETFKRETISDEILMVDVMYNYRTIKDIAVDGIAVPRELLSQIKHNGLSAIKKMKRNLHRRDRFLHEIFEESFLEKATFISQLVRHKKTDDYLELTREYLRRLAKAKFVVTSRIHCALPCLAMGTPVLFIDSELDQARISGLKELFNHIIIKGNGTMERNFEYSSKIGLTTALKNPDRYIPYKDELIRKVKEFVNSNESAYNLCQKNQSTYSR